MFDKNRDIKVGRDINIQVEENNFEKLGSEKLTLKKNDSILILKKENTKKFKRTFRLFLFALILFLVLYLGLPFFLNKYGNEENFIVSFLSKLIQDDKTILVLSGLASFITILNPISDLWKSNDIEKKQYEILKSINTILKEREYLKK
jgi:hypothetical protein